MQVDPDQGCLLGQLARDALSSLVEFQSQAQVRRDDTGGVRKLVEGGTWNAIAGQPTDVSEMALLLARMLADGGIYDADPAQRGLSPCAMLSAVRFWKRSQSRWRRISGSLLFSGAPV